MIAEKFKIKKSPWKAQASTIFGADQYKYKNKTKVSKNQPKH